MFIVNKYPIRWDTSLSQMWNDGANASVEMPEGSEVISVGQERNIPTLWAKIPVNHKDVAHRLVVIGDGWEQNFRPDWNRCFGRIDLPTSKGILAFHVFPLKEGNGS